MRTAVVLLFITPIAISSAMIAEIVSAEVEPGTATMSMPTEQTLVQASSLSSDKRSELRCFDHARVFRNRNEGAAHAADRTARHRSTLLHRVRQQRERGSRAVRSGSFKTHRLDDVGN